MIQAVLFDMDGLMIDSEPLAKEAWRQTLARYGRTVDETLFDRLLGLRQFECSRLLCEWLGLAQDPAVLMRERNELFMAMLPGRLRAMPGLFELLDWLKAHDIPRALVTSGLTSYVNAVLSELALDGTFSQVVTGETVSRGKPAPDGYLLAAERLGLLPENCLVLEDAPNGIAAAKAAGMLCWAVPNEYTRALDLSAADQIFLSLLAVRAALEQQYAVRSTQHAARST